MKFDVCNESDSLRIQVVSPRSSPLETIRGAKRRNIPSESDPENRD